MNRTQPTSPIDWPWGKVGALAAWCLAVLIGVASGFDPDTVLLRSLGAAFVGGVTAAVGAFVVKQLLPRA